MIRELEQSGIGTIPGKALNAPDLTELRQRLDALEEDMPGVPPSIYDRVEVKYLEPMFVDSVVQRPRSSGSVG